MLELYQFEGCPFCQRARQKLDELGLDYIIRTVPRDLNQRQRVIEISGQPLVPVLVDPENHKVIPDSARIIAYLEERFSNA